MELDHCLIVACVKCLVMRSQSTALWLSALSVLGGLTLGVVAFRLAGFLGMGLLGLLIGFIAIRIDLEKEGAVSSVFSTSLYAKQIAAQQRMTRAERAARKAEIRSLAGPLTVARTISVAFIVFGFGALFFLN